MFRPSDPLLRPDLDRLIIDDCDDRQLLNPGRIVDPESTNSDAATVDWRELLAVAS